MFFFRTHRLLGYFINNLKTHVSDYTNLKVKNMKVKMNYVFFSNISFPITTQRITWPCT